MRKSYERQILDCNIEKFSLMVRDNINLFSFTKIVTQVDGNVALQVYSVSGVKKIKEELKWYIEKSEQLRLGNSWPSCNDWYLAETAADKASVPRFIDALAEFIKQKRAKAREVNNVGDVRYKEANSSWARKYPIQVHDSITTWKAKVDNGGQVQYKRQAMRWAFEWQKSEEGWQRDHVWV